MNARHVSHLHEPRQKDVVLEGVCKSARIFVKCLQEIRRLPAIARLYVLPLIYWLRHYLQMYRHLCAYILQRSKQPSICNIIAVLLRNLVSCSAPRLAICRASALQHSSQIFPCTPGMAVFAKQGEQHSHGRAGAAVAAQRHCWRYVIDEPLEGRKKQHLNLPTKLTAALQKLLKESGLAGADVALHT